MEGEVLEPRLPLKAKKQQRSNLMDQIVKILTSEHIFLILGLILVAILIFSILKQVLKLIYFSVILILLYGGYLYYTGQKIPQTREELLQHGSEQLDRINKASKDFQEKMKKQKQQEKLQNELSG